MLREDEVLARLDAHMIPVSETESFEWADLGLGERISAQLRDSGAERPFPIQAATIPVIIGGRDVLGRARTGSGKTIAFGAPLVERLMLLGAGRNKQPGRKPKALILAPTRELVLQIDKTVQALARRVGLFTTQIYGGVHRRRQVGALVRGVDIVIGTPGRIEDLAEQGHLDLSEVVTVVIDEADHMCELGFLEPVQRILRLTKPRGQRLLFSATLDTEVAELAEEFLTNPAAFEVEGEDQASGTIEHLVVVLDPRKKIQAVKRLVEHEDRVLIFTRTRAFAADLAEELFSSGISSIALHGDLEQSERTKNLELFSSGKVNVLVATDVAARGIHVDNIPLVIQADAPDEYKTYLHRAGRTGRAGQRGRVIMFSSGRQQERVRELLERAEIEAPFRSLHELIG